MSGQKAMDLTGQRFGRLTVLREGERRKKQRYWVCECECGNIKEVQQAHLRNGSIVSCGCKRKEYEDLTGQRFGRLTVIEEGKYDRMTGQITNKKWDLNIRYWVCQCDCGNVVEVAYTNLKNGNTQSCGCLLADTNKLLKSHKIYLINRRIIMKKEIYNYMSVSEAAYRWNINERTLKEKLNIKRRPSLKEELEEGVVKYFKAPNSKKGNWIISIKAMEKWYGPEPRLVMLDEKTLDLDLLATYMDDELREEVNDMKFDTDQEYIELYIEQAYKRDPGFIEILKSEFGVNV